MYLGLYDLYNISIYILIGIIGQVLKKNIIRSKLVLVKKKIVRSKEKRNTKTYLLSTRN